MGSTQPPMKLAIIGGGIAGLALGVAIHKKHPHLDFHIYESVPEYKDVGAGLALHKNAIGAMGLIGPEVRKAYFDTASDMGEEDQVMSTEVILAQGPNTGTMVAELGKVKGRKSVSRADLIGALANLVPKEKLSFGKRVESMRETSDGVAISFKDGEDINVDFAIGSDGIHSTTRKYILGPEHPATEPKNHDGWQVYRTMVSTEAAKGQINERWTRIVPILLGPRGHVNCIPLNKGTRISAGVAVKGAKFTESGEAPPLDPELYSDYSEDAQQIVRMVAKDTSASWTAADHDHAPVYFRGRVGMMGDAAHASMPYAGNGAAQALEDVAVLDHLLSKLESVEQVPALFEAYDAVRRPRSQEVVDLARKFGRVYAYAEPTVGNTPEEMGRFFGGASKLTNEFDLQRQNDQAMQMFLKAVGRAEGSAV